MPPAESFPAFFARARQLPVFLILGVQGSGTNLLRSVLVAAFNFSIVQDQALVVRHAARLDGQPSREAIDKEFRRLMMHIQPDGLTRKTRRLIKTNASYAGVADVFDAGMVQSAADFATFFYSYGAYARATDLMAVKSDDLWEQIDHLDRVVPNRRIVLLTRDFRDNLLSVTNKDFGPVEPLVAAQYVRDRFRCYEREFDRTPAAHRYHIRYEDLLASPQAIVSAFAQHFGLPLTPEGAEAVDRLRIRSGNTRKWLVLGHDTVASCEGLLQAELTRYGYGTGDTVVSPGPSQLTAARCRDTVRRIPQKIRKLAKRLSK